MIDQALLDRLPEAAAAKLVAIAGAATDATDAANAAQARLNCTRNPTEAARLRATIAAQRRRAETFGALSSSIAQWLAALPDAVLEPSPPVTVAPRKDETVSAAISRVRDEFVAATNHLRAVRSAPMPKADIKSCARDLVRALSRDGRPQIVVDRERDVFDVVFIDPRDFDFGIPPVPLARLLAWLAPEPMLAALERDIDALPEAQASMPAAQRTRRLAEISARIDQLEREEEALVESAQAQGLDVLRRESASPAAVLGVAVAQAKAAAA
jgi:hypothetical protein